MFVPNSCVIRHGTPPAVTTDVTTSAVVSPTTTTKTTTAKPTSMDDPTSLMESLPTLPQANTPAPKMTDIPRPTITPLEIMTKADGKNYYHFNFNGDNNEDGTRDGISVENFNNWVYLSGCDSKIEWENDYLLIYREGGPEDNSSVKDCEIRFTNTFTDSFEKNEISMVRVVFSLSYGESKEGRNIFFHFYPSGIDVENYFYHESQFGVKFMCDVKPNPIFVTYSNGFETFYKTVNSNEPIDRYHTSGNATPNTDDTIRLTTERKQVSDGAITNPQFFLLNYEPSLNGTEVSLYLTNKPVSDFDNFPFVSNKREVDKINENNEGGLQCSKPIPYSFGVKYVGDGGIELRIYDIFIVTKPIP